MSIRIKLVLIIIFLNVSAIISLSYLAQTSFVSKFRQYRSNKLEKDIRLVKKVIEERLATLDTSSRDYAFWDDTYQFVQDRNNDYIISNLGNQTFENLDIDLMAFYDAYGKQFYRVSHATSNGEQLQQNAKLFDAVDKLVKENYGSANSNKGLINVDSDLYLASMQPVLKSNKDGPPMGTLVFIRRIDTPLENDIQDITQLKYTIYPFNTDSLKLDKTAAVLLRERGFYQYQSDKGAIGFGILKGLDGSPAGIIEMPSDIAMDTTISGYFRYFYIVSSFILVLSLVMGLVFIQLVVVRPITNLVKEINKIRTQKVSAQRITIKTTGEMQGLVNNINSMLDTLDSFDRKIVAVNEELERKAKELQDNTAELERLNRHMVGRELRMAELKEQIEDLNYKLNQKTDDL